MLVEFGSVGFGCCVVVDGVIGGVVVGVLRVIVDLFFKI